MIYNLPIPQSPELFESLVCDLLSAIHNTTNFQLYGRRGQKQNGIDIISFERKIVCQCKLKQQPPSTKTEKNAFLNMIIHELNSICQSNHAIEKIIIACSIENDTSIQDKIASLSVHFGVTIEFWSWQQINSYIFLFPEIISKYYNFRNPSIEIARFEVLSSLVYSKDKANNRVYYFLNNASENQLPIFDISFINNSEDITLLNSITAFSQSLFIVKAGFYDEPAGEVKVTKQYFMDLPLGKDFFDVGDNTLTLPDPLFIRPKGILRIQVQATKPIIGYRKITFAFNFNTKTLLSPELFFNSDFVGGGYLYRPF